MINEETKMCEAVIWDSTNKKAITKGTKTSSGNRVIELPPLALEALKLQKKLQDTEVVCLLSYAAKNS
ncbi:hypothetical protein [Pseudoalteromonas piscicida]